MCKTAPLPISCLITNDLLVFNLKTPFTKRYQPISIGWYLSEMCHKLHPEYVYKTISFDATLHLMSSMICSVNQIEHFNINNYTTSDLTSDPSPHSNLNTPLLNQCPTHSGISISSSFPIYGTHSHISTLILRLTQSDPPLLSSFGPTLTPPITALITTSSAHAPNALHHFIPPTSLLK